MKKRDWDSDWIYFSRRTRRGVFVLLFFFVIIAVLPRLYFTFISPPKDFDIHIASLAPNNENAIVEEDAEKSKYKQPENEFDPNTYTLKEWMKVGLSERQATSILKYLSKGGSLKVKSDLKKLYVIDDELYSVLEPMVDLPESLESSSEKVYGVYAQEKKEVAKENEDYALQTEEQSSLGVSDKIYRKVSINRATTEELQTIRGIGSFFATEIIKLRESYGGLLYPEQLLEIFRMDEEKLEELKPYLAFNKNEIKRININTATLSTLIKHPLISSDVARWIVYYRENHNEFNAVDNLLLCPYIDAKVLRELEPYIVVQ